MKNLNLILNLNLNLLSTLKVLQNWNAIKKHKYLES